MGIGNKIKEKINTARKQVGAQSEVDASLEEFFRAHAVYSPHNKDRRESTDISSILNSYSLKLIGMGIHQRVYRIEGTNWMLKEGRWDASIDVPIFRRIPFPSSLIDSTFRFLGGQPINPHIWHVFDEYRIYLEFCQYFGYFSDDSVYYHPNRDMMFMTQKSIRTSLKLFKPEIEKEYNIKLNGKLDSLFESDLRLINFLPKEYLLIANSVSEENHGKPTAMIFQEFVEGQSLREINSKDLQPALRQQLILMAYLILLMHMQIKLLPDTRPRYHIFEAYDWLTKTDNIIATKEKLAFIDTRWFWDSKGNILKRGFVIPKLTIDRCRSTLVKLLNEEI